MAGQVKQSTGHLLHRFMGKHERPYLQAIWMKYEVMPFILMDAQNIMIADDEVEGTLRECPTQLTEGFPFGIVHAVKEVAQQQQSPWLKRIHQLHQQFGIAHIASGGYRDAGFPEMIDLTPMQVGHHQGALPGEP